METISLGEVRYDIREGKYFTIVDTTIIFGQQMYIVLYENGFVNTFSLDLLLQRTILDRKEEWNG